MTFIKTFWGDDNTSNYMVAIRTNCYAASLTHIQRMTAELKKDYPEAEDKDITVVIYNIDSFKGIMGVEYNTKVAPPLPLVYFRVEIAPCKF